MLCFVKDNYWYTSERASSLPTPYQLGFVVKLETKVGANEI